MKRKKLLPLAAAALACGVLIAAPQAASALAPDQAAPEVLGQANDYYYYEDDGYISDDDTYGYIRLDQDELYLTIQPGSSSTSQYLKVLYVEDQSSRITWTSSNASVATVDGNGCVTGWSQGTAIITARSASGSVGSCIVYVDEASQLNTSVLSMEIEYNNPQPRSQLYLKSRNGYDDVLQWRSSNPAVVSVDRNGNLTAYQEGTATIYATTYRSGTLSCTVTVQNNIGRVTLNKSCMYLESIGAQGALRAKVAVANPEAVPITWTSSNTAAAVVDANGNVTAVGDGQAVITATSAEGRCASCKVYTGSVGARREEEPCGDHPRRGHRVGERAEEHRERARGRETLRGERRSREVDAEDHEVRERAEREAPERLGPPGAPEREAQAQKPPHPRASIRPRDARHHERETHGQEERVPVVPRAEDLHAPVGHRAEQRHRQRHEHG